MNVSAINIYPVKSLRGYAVQEAPVRLYGLEHDRQWILVTPSAQMITQRECPLLATITARADSSSLRISAPSHADIVVAHEPNSWTKDEVVVDVFGHSYVGLAAAASVNQELSERVGMDCRLLSIRSDVFRVKRDVAFHDDEAIHIISEASLEELNRRLPTPLPMNRFRPSIVVAGAEPFAEGSWQRIAIGGTVFRAVKACIRCVITTTDQERGVVSGPEPLKTLATFRRKGDGVAFGHYYQPETAGATVHVNDELSVLSAVASD